MSDMDTFFFWQSDIVLRITYARIIKLYLRKQGGLGSMFTKLEIKYSGLVFIFVFYVMVVVVVVGGWRYLQRKGCLCISWVHSMSENCLCLSVSLVTSPNYPLQFYAKWVCVLMCTSAHSFLCVFAQEMFLDFFLSPVCIYRVCIL